MDEISPQALGDVSERTEIWADLKQACKKIEREPRSL